MRSGRHWRNQPHGYGLVTKAMHWTLAAALAAQLVIGYSLDGDGRGRGRGRGRGGESGRGRGRGGDEYDVFGADTLLTIHVVLGLTILALATVRLVWRVSTPLPAWAPTLSPGERRLAHWTERLLYVLMVAIPISGLVLVVAGDDDWVGAHIATHVAFFVVIAMHIGLVAKHQVIDRDGLLGRMGRQRTAR